MVVWDNNVVELALSRINEILNCSTRKEIECRIRNTTGVNKTGSNSNRNCNDLVDQELDSILSPFDLKSLLKKIAENAYKSYKSILEKGGNGVSMSINTKTFLMWQVFRQSLIQTIHGEVLNRLKNKVKSTLTDPSLYANPGSIDKKYINNESIGNLMRKGYAIQQLNYNLSAAFDLLSVMDFEGKFTDLSGVNPAFKCSHVLLTKKDSPKMLHNLINLLYSIPYQLNRDCGLKLQTATSITAISINSKFAIQLHKDPDNITAFLVVSNNNCPVNLHINGQSLLINDFEYGVSSNSSAYLLAVFLLSPDKTR